MPPLTTGRGAELALTVKLLMVTPASWQLATKAKVHEMSVTSGGARTRFKYLQSKVDWPVAVAVLVFSSLTRQSIHDFND